MTSVNTHSVVHHCVLNLIDDGGASRLDAQSPLHLTTQSAFSSETHRKSAVNTKINHRKYQVNSPSKLEGTLKVQVVGIYSRHIVGL